MVRRRHGVNPAKVKLAASVIEANPPLEIFQQRLELRRRWSVTLLNLLSVVLLTVSFAPFDCWFLGFVALVPWAMALAGGMHRRWSLLCGTLAGTVFWAANLYWLSWITLAGYAASVVYLSAYWFLAAVIVRASLRRNWPMWLVLPIVWVSLEYVRAYVIGGFPWFFLAHSQYAQTRLIQIADVTGQYGVSFFVAMVNGAMVDLMVHPLFVRSRRGARLAHEIFISLMATALTAAALLGYGTWRLSQQTQKRGPIIGIVQQAFPISLHGRSAGPDKILQSHIRASEGFIRPGGGRPELVIWPETMLPGDLNPEMIDMDLTKLRGADLRLLAERTFGPAVWEGKYSDAVIRGNLQREMDLRRKQAEMLGVLSRRLACPVLAGAVTLHRNPAPVDRSDRWLRRNSALWFDRSARPTATYAKMHLVPFSEYVPFKSSWPGLYRLLRRFVPAVMEQLAPGRRLTRFKLARDGQVWRLASPICYEGTFARVCRAMVVQNGRKTVDILANLSNDGWFVWEWSDRRQHASTEHAQHLVQYCFRAVENRVPVVRAVNTGISGSIDSNGRIVAVVNQQGRRKMVAGTLLLDGLPGDDKDYKLQHGPQVLVDARLSVYSLAGDVFAVTVGLVAVAMVIMLGWRRLKVKKEVNA